MKARLVTFAKVKNMLKVDIPEGSGKWAHCSAQVMKFAKENFKEGDEVDLEYKQENGQFHISFIKKPGATSSPKKSYNRPKGNSGKTEDDKEDMRRENANHCVSRTLIALQGQVDLNNVHELIDGLFQHYLENITNR